MIKIEKYYLREGEKGFFFEYSCSITSIFEQSNGTIDSQADIWDVTYDNMETMLPKEILRTYADESTIRVNNPIYDSRTDKEIIAYLNKNIFYVGYSFTSRKKVHQHLIDNMQKIYAYNKQGAFKKYCRNNKDIVKNHNKYKSIVVFTEKEYKQSKRELQLLKEG